MKLRNIRPMLMVSDMQATIDYYTNVLGFICENYEVDWGWASLVRDDANVMLVASETDSAPKPREPSSWGSLYIDVDNVDALWRELKDKTDVCYPLETFFYGMREFAVYDNNGNLLKFGMPVD